MSNVRIFIFLNLLVWIVGAILLLVDLSMWAYGVIFFALSVAAIVSLGVVGPKALRERIRNYFNWLYSPRITLLRMVFTIFLVVVAVVVAIIVSAIK